MVVIEITILMDRRQLLSDSYHPMTVHLKHNMANCISDLRYECQN